MEVKMLDVEVLGWCGYMWSAVVRLVGCTVKFSETLFEDGLRLAAVSVIVRGPVPHCGQSTRVQALEE
ncbi:hypothetical protein SRHO_G00071780 [Serrasalmus rhombeus]